MTPYIELLLFGKGPEMIAEAERAGIDGFIVDWEHRQDLPSGHPLADLAQPDTLDDLRTARASTSHPLWCRINPMGVTAPLEIERAVAAGADLIMLPMATSVEEVRQFVDLVAERARCGILVETVAACECADELADLPLARVYVGLFDLMFDRGSNDLFTPLTDGTLARLRDTFCDTSLGVAGLTTIGRGSPIPTLEIMAHLVRLGCDFTFLRNSFKQDVAGADMRIEVNRIRQAWAELSTRPGETRPGDVHESRADGVG